MRLERHQRFYFRMSQESDERRFFKRRRRKKEFGVDWEKGVFTFLMIFVCNEVI